MGAALLLLLLPVDVETRALPPIASAPSETVEPFLEMVPAAAPAAAAAAVVLVNNALLAAAVELEPVSRAFNPCDGAVVEATGPGSAAGIAKPLAAR